MKQQKHGFVNPFWNILFENCFCAGLGVGSRRNRSCTDTLAVDMEVGFPGAARAVSLRKLSPALISKTAAKPLRTNGLRVLRQKLASQGLHP
jgi:hypothetical protein